MWNSRRPLNAAACWGVICLQAVWDSFEQEACHSHTQHALLAPAFAAKHDNLNPPGILSLTDAIIFMNECTWPAYRCAIAYKGEHAVCSSSKLKPGYFKHSIQCNMLRLDILVLLYESKPFCQNKPNHDPPLGVMRVRWISSCNDRGLPLLQVLIAAAGNERIDAARPARRSPPR